MADENPIVNFMKSATGNPATWIGAVVGGAGLFLLGGGLEGGGLLKLLLGLLGGGLAGAVISAATGMGQSDSTLKISVPANQQSVKVEPGKTIELGFDVGKGKTPLWLKGKLSEDKTGFLVEATGSEDKNGKVTWMPMLLSSQKITLPVKDGRVDLTKVERKEDALTVHFLDRDGKPQSMGFSILKPGTYGDLNADVRISEVEGKEYGIIYLSNMAGGTYATFQHSGIRSLEFT